MRLSTAVDLPRIPLQIPGWSYFTQGYEAHYVRGENLASPFLFSWVSSYLFCVCVWWLKCQQLGSVTGVHVPALSATGVTEACAYCVVTTKVDKSVTRLRDWELGADVVISLGCILVLAIVTGKTKRSGGIATGVNTYRPRPAREETCYMCICLCTRQMVTCSCQQLGRQGIQGTDTGQKRVSKARFWWDQYCMFTAHVFSTNGISC